MDVEQTLIAQEMQISQLTQRLAAQERMLQYVCATLNINAGAVPEIVTAPPQPQVVVAPPVMPPVVIRPDWGHEHWGDHHWPH